MMHAQHPRLSFAGERTVVPVPDAKGPKVKLEAPIPPHRPAV